MADARASGAFRSQILQWILISLGLWATLYARCSLGPLQETLKTTLALTDDQIAFLQGPVLALPMIVLGIPIGMLLDRYPRRPQFLIALLLATVGSLFTAWAWSAATMIIGRLCVGLSAAIALVAAYSLVADCSDPAVRGKATMIVAWGEVASAPAAFAFGSMLLAPGFLTSELGFHHEGWRQAQLVMALVIFPVMAAMLCLRNPPPIARSQRVRGEDWRELWRCRTFVVPLLFARVMTWIADGGVFVWASPLLQRRFGLGATAAGSVVAAALLASSIAGPMLGGLLADSCQRRSGPRGTATALAVLAALSAIPAFFGVAPSALVASVMIAGFLTLGYAFGATAMTLSTIVIPSTSRGLYLAISIVVSAVFSTALAPMLISRTTAILGGPAHLGVALAAVCATASLLAAVIFATSRSSFAAAGSTPRGP